ncbi:MAG: hypothetical protein RDV48_22095 [Candidatus Eremiobacteraeota bacterium]|nr:hypothetical protein [Candidatus Eremiobacteraeota bacterium]
MGSGVWHGIDMKRICPTMPGSLHSEFTIISKGECFLRVRVLGDFDTTLLSGKEYDLEPLPDCFDDSGRVPVLQVTREQKSADRTPVFVVTARDLKAPGLRRLFGFSDSRRQTAVVSTYHLHGDKKELIHDRLEKVMAHEGGHLRGLRHCTTPGCLMYPAQSMEDLDGRSTALCPRCLTPRPKYLRGALFLLMVSALLIMALDSLGAALRQKNIPFSWQPMNGKAAIFFKDQALVSLNDIPGAPARVRAQSFTKSLNAVFQQLDPAPFAVSSPSPGRAALLAGTMPLIEFTAEDAGGGDPLVFAEKVLGKIEPVMRGKGNAAEGCPSCHVHRLAEVERWSRECGKGRR